MKWKAKPMLGSPKWGVTDGQGTVKVLGLTEAEAKLIAAAPNLLELAERILLSGHRQSETYQMAKDAIAKATI